jgi:hypothetical protein
MGPTIDIAFSFIILVMLTEHSRTNGACKMLQVVLFVQGIDMRSTQCSTTLGTEQVKPFEIIMLTINFDAAGFAFNREKLFRYNLIAFLLFFTEYKFI